MARHSVPGMPRRKRPSIPQLEAWYMSNFGETMYPGHDLRIGGKSFDRAAYELALRLFRESGEPIRQDGLTA